VADDAMGRQVVGGSSPQVADSLARRLWRDGAPARAAARRADAPHPPPPALVARRPRLP
jgi:hypothetical protein